MVIGTSLLPHHRTERVAYLTVRLGKAGTDEILSDLPGIEKYTDYSTFMLVPDGKENE